MDIRNRRALKQAADGVLAASAYDPRRLVLIHSGATVALSVAATLIACLLDTQIGKTGGLSGLSARTNLEAIRSLVAFLPTFLVVFWNVGYSYWALKTSRGEGVGAEGLLEGFRRFWPVVRCTLLQFFLYLSVAILCVYVASFLFMMTPAAVPMMEIMMESETAIADVTALDAASQAALSQAMLPMVGIFLLLFSGLALLISYPLRMTTYTLLDDTKAGALAAMRTSGRLLRGSKGALFRLDLSFWWYYLLQAVLVVVCYLDVLLEAAGISLPLSPEVAGYGCYGLSLVGQMALFVWAKNRVEGTYVQFYEALRQPGQPNPEPAPAPKRQPWNYG